MDKSIGYRVNRWTNNNEGKTLALVLIILFFAFGAMLAVVNITCREGYEITVTGTVSVHKLDHSKLFNFDYTEIELLTFSGEEYELTLLDHIELDFGTTYAITFKRTSPLGHHVFLYGKVVSITPINVTKTWAWYPP